MTVARPSETVVYKAPYLPGLESYQPTPGYNMATAVDPTYPLYPIACILASAMLLLISLTTVIRQSWNFGLASLCFWLFFENLTFGINSIIWADNADVKFYVYCDIGKFMQP